LADVHKARRLLGYEPTHELAEGLDETLDHVVAAAEGSRA
jgi:nucleoside-diphosphate-sugar epimerase